MFHLLLPISRTAVTPYMLKKLHQFYMDEDVGTFLNNSLKTSNSVCLQVRLFTSAPASPLSFLHLFLESLWKISKVLGISLERKC